MPGGIMTNLDRHLDESFIRRFTENPSMRKWMKSPAQGAATTVWAAVGREWEGKGGVYLEDCQVSPPAPAKADLAATERGFKPYAYDVDGAKKLWEVSCQQTGTAES